MKEFYKYHGAGNDFIVLDDRYNSFDVKDIEQIKLLCHRHLGVGGDGILLVRNHHKYDFEMVFINSDGSMGAMCGNGGRCIVHFAHFVLGMVKDTKHITFLAADGEHEAEIIDEQTIKLKMQDVKDVITRNGLPFVCQGTTPHNIMFVEDLENYPVVSEGRKIRNSDPNGVNVNFVEIKGDTVNVRTYERGVENETMACGTGATSVTVTVHFLGKIRGNGCHIQMPGGMLTIEFEKQEDGSYKNIWMTGPVVSVFKGEMS